RLGTATYVLRRHSPLPERPADSTARADGDGSANGRRPAASTTLRYGAIQAPMPGQVIAVLVTIGQQVKPGEPLVILEAMKMEHTLKARHAGVVEGIRVGHGEQVPAAAVLLELRPLAAGADGL